MKEKRVNQLAQELGLELKETYALLNAFSETTYKHHAQTVSNADAVEATKRSSELLTETNEQSEDTDMTETTEVTETTKVPDKKADILKGVKWTIKDGKTKEFKAWKQKNPEQYKAFIDREIEKIEVGKVAYQKKMKEQNK